MTSHKAGELPVNMGNVTIKHETEKAVLVIFPGAKEVWVPQKAIHDDSEVWKRGSSASSSCVRGSLEHEDGRPDVILGRLEDTLHDEPKFYRVADRLGISFVEVAGHMAVLWSWAHRHAPDGDLRDFDVPDIERAAKWDGETGAFVSVLADDRVNLLDRTDRGFVLHRFMERAEARKAAKRKQKQRLSRDKKNHVPGQSPDSPGNVPEERRGEEKEKRGGRDLIHRRLRRPVFQNPRRLPGRLPKALRAGRQMGRSIGGTGETPAGRLAARNRRIVPRAACRR